MLEDVDQAGTLPLLCSWSETADKHLLTLSLIFLKPVVWWPLTSSRSRNGCSLVSIQKSTTPADQMSALYPYSEAALSRSRVPN